jgi:hypothetical protein
MSNLNIEEVYTGGGCNHYKVDVPQYGIYFIVNNNDCNTPEPGEDWGFCVYDNEENENSGNWLYCEGPFDDFNKDTLTQFIKGYIAAKSLRKIDGYFDIEKVNYEFLCDEILSTCEPHVLHNALYAYVSKLSKEDLLTYLQTLDSNKSFTIFDYLN